MNTESQIIVSAPDLPAFDELIEEAELLLEASKTWKVGETFGKVETFSSAGSRDSGRSNSPKWYCRVSEHQRDDITFGTLWRYLGGNKVPNEQRFIPEIKKVMRVQYISESQSIWSKCYTGPPPFSPRIFTFLQVVQLRNYPAHGRTGIMISIPVDLSSEKDLLELEEKGIRARQVRVERLQELNDGKLIEWRLVTKEDFGGCIPRIWMQRLTLQNMAKDVSSFISWVQQQRHIG
ncbi:hypothetical protein BDZ94DRAFT_1157256 [Collybia nuda]|uniref:DUF3074 domain-containing protein n=1 Tax=Collybia nuda TaxID=64659 RepID=A0A9P6CNN4_9AGAR|nr:hypothetical protein BDZ94DRAFT_1157256 [Collybia nuda]